MIHLYIEGITQKGWKKVMSSGIHWVVKARTEKILFNPEPGPWLLIIPFGETEPDKGFWIKEYDDKDFKIVQRMDDQG